MQQGPVAVHRPPVSGPALMRALTYVTCLTAALIAYGSTSLMYVDSPQNPCKNLGRVAYGSMIRQRIRQSVLRPMAPTPIQEVRTDMLILNTTPPAGLTLL